MSLFNEIPWPKGHAYFSFAVPTPLWRSEPRPSPDCKRRGWRRGKILAVGIIFSCLAATQSFAADDGFGSGRKTESKHFVIYYSPQVDLSYLALQLNVSPSDNLLAGKPVGRGEVTELGTSVADMLDTLFTQVCDILDMQLFSFQGEIKVCRDERQLKEVYYNLFRKDLEARSFYVNSLNTIYIASDSFKREILGHEMAHAIVSHYFVVLPSVKIQELLATYTEYQLRK